MEGLNDTKLLDSLKNLIKKFPKDYSNIFVEQLKSNGVLNNQIEIFVNQFYNYKHISLEERDNIFKVLKSNSVK